MSACTSKEFAFPWEDGRVTLAGANQVLEPDLEAFNNAQLASLIDPAGFRGQPGIIRSTSIAGELKAVTVYQASSDVAKAKTTLEAAEAALAKIGEDIDALRTRPDLFFAFATRTRTTAALRQVDELAAVNRPVLSLLRTGVTVPAEDLLEMLPGSVAAKVRKVEDGEKWTETAIAELEAYISQHEEASAGFSADLEKLDAHIADIAPELAGLEQQAAEAQKQKKAAEQRLEETEAVLAAAEAIEGTPNAGIDGATDGAMTAVDPIEEVDLAMFVANNYGGAQNHRNRIQDRLLVASQQRCNFFKDYIRRIDAYKSFGLGSLTTILGGASAIVTDEVAARVLGGSAGIVSGVRAEFDQAFFQNLAVHVITPAIEIRRNSTLRTIRTRQKLSINDYSVQAAVREALEYHNQCSLNAGFEEAAESIKTVKDPGLLASTETVKKIRRLSREIDALTGKATVDVLDSFNLPVRVLATVKHEGNTQHAALTEKLGAVAALTETSVAGSTDGLLSELNEAKEALDAALADADDQAAKISAAAQEADETREIAIKSGNDAFEASDFVAKNAAALALSETYRAALAAYRNVAGPIDSKLDAMLVKARQELADKAKALSAGETGRKKAFLETFGIAESVLAQDRDQAIDDILASASAKKLKEINEFLKVPGTAGPTPEPPPPPPPAELSNDEAKAIFDVFDVTPTFGAPSDGNRDKWATEMLPLVEELQVAMGLTGADGDAGTTTRPLMRKLFPDGLTKDAYAALIERRKADAAITPEAEAAHAATAFEKTLSAGSDALAALNAGLGLTGGDAIADFTALHALKEDDKDDVKAKKVAAHKLVMDKRVALGMAKSGIVTRVFLEKLK